MRESSLDSAEFCVFRARAANGGGVQAIIPRPITTGAEGCCLTEYLKKLRLIPS